MKHYFLYVLLPLLLTITSCTGSSSSTSLVGNITDTVKDIVNPDPSVNTAEKQISEIQKELNQNATYALTEDDVAFLKADGLQINESEIKAWVK